MIKETTHTADDSNNTSFLKKVLSKISSFKTYLQYGLSFQEKTLKIEGSYYHECTIAHDSSKINIGNQLSKVELEEAVLSAFEKNKTFKRVWRERIERKYINHCIRMEKKFINHCIRMEKKLDTFINEMLCRTEVQQIKYPIEGLF